MSERLFQIFQNRYNFYLKLIMQDVTVFPIGTYYKNVYYTLIIIGDIYTTIKIYHTFTNSLKCSLKKIKKLINSLKCINCALCCEFPHQILWISKNTHQHMAVLASSNKVNVHAPRRESILQST